MATPRVTIDQLPEQPTPEDSNLIVVHDETITKKMSLATLKTMPSAALEAHLADTSDAHAASAISSTDSGAGINGTTVQGQLGQLASLAGSTSNGLAAHVNAPDDAHDATAISATPHLNVTATDVQGQLEELATALSIKDVVWVGPDAPTDPVVEMWWDSNEPGSYLPVVPTEFATDEETIDGILTDKAVTPAGLAAVYPVNQAIYDPLTSGTFPAPSTPGVYIFDAAPRIAKITGRWKLRGEGQVLFKLADAAMSTDNQPMVRLAAATASVANRFVVKDITFDGNRTNNVPPTASAWEHSAIIAVGDAGTAWIESVLLSNLEFRDPVADCIWVSTYYVDSVQINNITSLNRAGTRSCIEFSGMPRIAQISNVDIERLEAEPLGIPAAVTHNFEIQVTNAHIRQLFDMGGPTTVGRTRWDCNHVVAADFTAVRVGGTVKGSEIHFPVNSYNARRIISPRKLVFEDCDFYLDADASGVIVPITINPLANDPTSCAFKDCRFHLVPGAHPGPYTGAAITATPWSGSTIPEYEISNCWFDARFEHSVTLDRCGRVVLRDNDYGGVSAAIRTASSATIAMYCYVDGGNFDRVTGNMFYITGATSAIGALQVRNVEVPLARAGLAGSGTSAWPTMPINSNRVITVTATPTGAGLRGDIARLENPVQGSPMEWICTGSAASAATWRPIAAAGPKTGVTVDAASIHAALVALGLITT